MGNDQRTVSDLLDIADNINANLFYTSKTKEERFFIFCQIVLLDFFEGIGLTEEVGDIIYRLSDEIPAEKRATVNIYPCADSGYHTLASWRADWEYSRYGNIRFFHQHPTGRYWH